MKRKWGMAIDLDKCTGCGACQIACMQENNMPIFEDDSDIPKRVTFLDLMRVTNDTDKSKKYGDVKVAFLPKMCQQCGGNNAGGREMISVDIVKKKVLAGEKVFYPGMLYDEKGNILYRPEKVITKAIIEEIEKKGIKNVYYDNPQPPCVSVCPVVATDVGDDGVVSQIWSRCIGCRYCMTACPYEARAFNWWKPEYEGDFKKGLNPDVSVPSRGAVIKCTFCSHIWKRERDKALAKGVKDIDAVAYTPACASACPTGAIVFGDLSDKNSPVYEGKLQKDPNAVRLVNAIDKMDDEKKKKFIKSKDYPNPKVYYLSGQKWLRDIISGFKNS
jgi:Fe-S-cluster-containing dehydrogenase component